MTAIAAESERCSIRAARILASSTLSSAMRSTSAAVITRLAPAGLAGGFCGGGRGGMARVPPGGLPVADRARDGLPEPRPADDDGAPLAAAMRFWLRTRSG